jgi:hypothetical protein
LEDGNNQSIIIQRQNIIRDSINVNFSSSRYLETFQSFDQDMLMYCQQLWQVCGISILPLIEDDNHTFKSELAYKIELSLLGVRKLLESSEDANHGFTLSSMMAQFNIRGLKSIDRYIEYNEAIFAAFISKFILYYELMGLDPKVMISIDESSIRLSLGEKYFYNDIFNPLLSAVYKGIDIAVLQMECMMLMKTINLNGIPDISDRNIKFILDA